MNNFLTLNKRYLVIGIIIFVVSVYTGLTLGIDDIPSVSFYIYTACFAGLFTVLFIPFLIIFRKSRESLTTITCIYVAVLVFVLGILRTFSASVSLNKERQLISEATAIRGIFTSDARISTSGKSYAADADIYEISDGNNYISLKKPAKVLLYFPSDNDTPQYGTSFQCSAAFDFTSSSGGAFDYNQYLKQKKICYTTYCHKYTLTDSTYNESLTVQLKKLGIRLRSLISASCESQIYSDDEEALLKGIMLGDSSGFSDSLYESYTDSGLVHIISVSGMHTSYLFLVISVILSFFRLPRKLYPFFAIPVLVIFGAISLYTPSVSRSLIMLSVLLLAPLFSRKNDSITALAISAAIIIFHNPFSLESYSLILSFSATTGLLVFTDPLSRVVRPLIKIKSQNSFLTGLNYPIRYIADSVCLTAGGILGTSYFTARFFGKIPLAGLIANIPIFPLVAISFVGGYINCIIYYIFPSLSQLVATHILKPALYLTNKISSIFSLDIFTLRTPYPPDSFLVVYIVILCVIYILLSNRINTQSE